MEAEKVAEENQKRPVMSQPKEKTTKMTFEQYQKLAVQVCEIIEEASKETDQDSIPQGEVVNKIVQKMVEEENQAHSIERMAEIAK